MKSTFLAFTLLAGTAFAQQPANAAQGKPVASSAPVTTQVDARFAAWLGCWRLDDDLAGTGARMCITPEKNGVRLQTIVGTQKGIDELVIADGAAHSIVDSECKGTERAEWSKDGARMFRTTEVTCGKEAARTIKAVTFMVPGPSWISIQHVSGSAANTSVRVQRYRRAANQSLADGSKAPQPDAQLATRTTPDLTNWSTEDVIEASSKVPMEAMQAVLTEVPNKFNVNKKTLLALADGGVSEPVIDLMVALAYPKRFVVERAGGGASTSGILTGMGVFDPFMSPLLMGAMADCYSPYGYGYRSYYSMCGSAMYRPFGFDYFGYNTLYYPNGYYGDWVNVGNYPGVIGSVNVAEPQGDGRVIRGQGFTQIRNRDAEPTPRINAGGNGGSWSGGGNSGGASAGSGFSSGSSSGGGGGDSSPRVAVPKGGGQ